MVSLSQTSLPGWAHEPRVEEPDPTGRAFLLLGVGEGSGAGVGAGGVLDAWAAALPADRAVRRHLAADADEAAAVLADHLAAARVGVRVMVAGATQDCLALRAAAVRAGVADDEMRFGVVTTGARTARTVWCVHCGATTTAPVDVDDVLACSGCARDLVVYAHVSRRTGHHLGFMVDAEDQPWEVPA